jgi:hypothetical protein
MFYFDHWHSHAGIDTKYKKTDLQKNQLPDHPLQVMLNPEQEDNHQLDLLASVVPFAVRDLS